MTRTIKAIIEGKVQGVWYRDSTRRWAMAAGVTGYAHNLPDGSVEVVATGEAAAIGGLITWLHQGPPKARVDKVTVEEIPPQNFPDFTMG